MYFLRIASLALGVLSSMLFLACSSSVVSEEPDGTGGKGPVDTECGSDLSITVVAGEGVGAVFSAFEEGDTLVPYFGSQAGMEVAVSVQLTGYERGDINSIEVYLNVDGAPIGFDSFSPRAVYCEAGAGTIETPVLIDVTEHPSVTSVAQLNGREAEIEVIIGGDEGEETSSVTVVLEI